MVEIPAQSLHALNELRPRPDGSLAGSYADFTYLPTCIEKEDSKRLSRIIIL